MISLKQPYVFQSGVVHVVVFSQRSALNIFECAAHTLEEELVEVLVGVLLGVDELFVALLSGGLRVSRGRSRARACRSTCSRTRSAA
jgi:hypothetical protein